MNRTLSILLLFLAASATAQVPMPAAAGAVGDLLVAPTRVVLNERTRTAEIALINTGTASTTYRISFRHMRMNADGMLADVASEEGERFADSYLLFTPRQVTLEPQVAQTVRVRLRLPEGASEGEYRTHLEFRGLPPSDLTDSTGLAEDKVGVRVVPIYSISIPLLVRRGATDAELAMDGLRVVNDEKAMQAAFTLQRTGTRSTYGNIVARFTPHGGEEETVGVMNGVALYLPLSERHITVPLHATDGKPLRNGLLRVTYVDADRTADGPPVEARIALP
jgi:P pilus assembly chaperone PapD